MQELRHTPLAIAGIITMALTACSSTGEDTVKFSPTQGEEVSAQATSVASATSAEASAGTSVSPASKQASTSPAKATPQGSEPAQPGPTYFADTSRASSLNVVVNKQNPLNPSTYAPADLQPIGGVYLRAQASQAAQKMFADAAAAGAPMTALSGYRSYETQQATYAGWVAQYGREGADVASARPGYSEHQTGLALDIGSGSDCDLQPCFRDTATALWAAEHAHEYGFIVRYPWMEHETTGYWYESWHLRYIGKEQAKAYKESGAKTLEEFYGLPAAPSY
ncbi:M15 family metallopeptidase [Rothia sp. CCM 9417]|uniref:M15 family metallopeptidase n=1 Tax=Rothia sp. CCM 9417 TaxID=3402657 RepID=UPI003AD8DC01